MALGPTSLTKMLSLGVKIKKFQLKNIVLDKPLKLRLVVENGSTSSH